MEIFGSVGDILRGKGTQVWTTTPEVTVFEAVRLMGEKNVGALVVLEADQVAGVISERDYTRKVVLRGRTSHDTKVGEILSRPVITATPADTVEHCLEVMTEQRVRHLPVVEGGKLAGLISMGDLVNWVIHVQRQTIQHLQSYITGSYPG